MKKCEESVDFPKMVICPYCYMYIDTSLIDRDIPVKHTVNENLIENGCLCYTTMDCPNCGEEFILDEHIETV